MTRLCEVSSSFSFVKFDESASNDLRGFFNITFTLASDKKLNKLIKIMEKQFLGSDDAAKFLGISKNQLYKLNASGKIQSYSPTGGKLYFKVEELEEWVLSGKKSIKKDIQKGTNNFLIHKKQKK